MTNLQLIIQEIKHNLSTRLSPDLTYHNFQHSFSVVAICNQYIAHYGIDKKHAELLRLAAWGHDYGFISTYHNHEQESAKLIGELMTNYQFSKDEIELVQSLILATRIPQAPKTLLEKIICDADLDYLGKGNYQSISHGLYLEFKAYSIVSNADQWLDMTIAFLTDHHYQTMYARQHLAPYKNQVLQMLQKQQRDSYYSAA